MSKRLWYAAAVIGLMMISGCNGRENPLVRVTFPDDAAREQARWLRVVAIVPDQGSGCDPLMQGLTAPGYAGYPIESEVGFEWPAAGGVEGLAEVSAGPKLFYAEAEDAGGAVFLRGCTPAQVGEQEGREVVIALERLSQPCQVDADCGTRTCEGLVWVQPTCLAGLCSGSETVADCEDSNDCTQDSCDDLDGCANLPLAAGTDCGVCVACDGQGVCIDDLTKDEDCPVCQECRPAGTCDYQATGSDVKEDCVDDIFCDGEETCDGSGGCQAGSDPCPGLTCNEDSDSCEGCLADADCPVCQECNAGACESQTVGSDRKDECAADACNTGACDGAGACGLEAAGTDCGVCAACDGLGLCIQDLTQDQDCPVCQECESAGSCANQTAGAPCDDGDSCSSQDACDGAGVCAAGATDKDTDGDSYYDDACPGGDDCDDDAPAVNPGATEGPDGDPTCSDGADNDCDGQTDNCTAPEGYRKQITIDFNQVAGGSDLPDFPVLISIAGDDDLKTTANGGRVVNADGYDITFRAADGATSLDHEVEEYDPAGGTLLAWVRIPVLSASADTVIYVYYGYSGITSPTENPAAVWDGSYVGVWHLTEDAADTGALDLYEDSTANSNHGDDYVSATGKSGQISGGQAFDGIDDYVDCGNNAVLDVSYLTVEFWLNVNTWISDGGILAKGDNTYRQYWIWTYDGQVAFEIDEGGNVNYAWAPTAGGWEHLAIIYDGANVTTYRNGLQENTYPQATGAIDPSTQPLLLGSIPSFHYADFALDELRISNVARPLGWIATGYNNQSSPSGFFSIGSEEPQ